MVKNPDYLRQLLWPQNHPDDTRMGHASKQMVYEVYGNYVEGLESDAENIFSYFGADFLKPKPQNIIKFPRMERCDEEVKLRRIAA